MPLGRTLRKGSHYRLAHACRDSIRLRLLLHLHCCRNVQDALTHLRAPRAFPSMPRYSGLRPSDFRLTSANPRASTLQGHGRYTRARKRFVAEPREVNVCRQTMERWIDNFGGLAQGGTLHHRVRYRGENRSVRVFMSCPCPSSNHCPQGEDDELVRELRPLNLFTFLSR